MSARLIAIEQSSTLEQLLERTDSAFEAVNELEECGLISRRERVTWGGDIKAVSSARQADLE